MHIENNCFDLPAGLKTSQVEIRFTQSIIIRLSTHYLDSKVPKNVYSVRYLRKDETLEDDNTGTGSGI